MTTSVDWAYLQKELAKPFPAEVILWRAGAQTRDKKRAQALPYAEPRIYEDRLNDVCGGNWSLTFKPWSENRIICELTIYGVTRASTGEENDGFAPGTAAEAQAFKRACSKFGLGRYLYDVPIQWVDFDTEKGRLIETPTLAARFMPQTSIDTTPRLSMDRAEAMRLELEKLGYASMSHPALVESATGRKVSALAQLSEAEALEVWSYAKRSHQKAA